MSQTVIIEPIDTAVDAKEISELFFANYAESPYDGTWTKETVHQHVLDMVGPCKDYSFKAVVDGKIVGVIYAMPQCWPKGRVLYIFHCHVALGFRGSGIGKKMYEYMLSLAKEKEFYQVSLQSHKDSKAFGFWKQKGFSEDPYVYMSLDL